MRIGYALAACFAMAVAGLIALWLAALALLNHPQLSSSKQLAVRDAVGIAQLVFASVAGAGALVALVVAYRRQRLAETTATLDRTRVLNERFATIAAQLGADHAAVRLAGVHAMAGLADDWEENRQTCIDVLCAYLRLPYKPEPGQNADPADWLAFEGNREVRWTVMRVITEHLRDPGSGAREGTGVEKQVAPVSWQGRNFNFTGVVFDGGTFSYARFALDKGGKGGKCDFGRAEFSASQKVNFHHTKFSGGTVDFHHARFSRGSVQFHDAKFSDGTVSFRDAKFLDGTVSFSRAKFSGGEVSFTGAKFSGGEVSFDGAVVSGGSVDFRLAGDWSDPPKFDWATPPDGVKPYAAASGEPQ